jgi:hypothetical protein
MKPALVVAVSLIFVTAGGLATAQTQWVFEPEMPVIAPDILEAYEPNGHRYPVAALKVDGVYHLYFTSRTDQGDGTGTLQIDHATSPDGMVWDLDPANPVLAGGAEEEWDHGSIPGAAVIHDGSEFRMWYAVAAPAPNWFGDTWHGLGYATSLDGSSWTKYADNPIVDPGCPPSADIRPMIPHSVVIEQPWGSDVYRMWATVGRTSYPTSIEIVYSGDGLEWSTVYHEIQIDGTGWNATDAPNVSFDGTHYHMAFWNHFFFPVMYYAISQDGDHWTVPIMGGLPWGDRRRVWGYSPAVLAEDGALTIWYRGWRDTGIYRATSDCCSTVYTRFIPAAAHGEGNRGSFYRTDAHLCNDGETTAEYRFAWFPRGRDNSDWIRSGFFSLGSGMCESHEDILDVVFGLEPGAFGALAVQSSSQDLIVTAEILTSQDGTPAATIGQSLPIIQRAETPRWDQRIVFGGDLAGARRNVSCFNLNFSDRDLELNIYSSDGRYLRTVEMLLPPWSSDQINRVFRDYEQMSGYVQVFEVNRDYYCFGSVVDNHSGATKIIPPQ